MGYDLLIASPGQIRTVTLPFYWLARLVALPLWHGPSPQYFSITRGRHDIIWRNARDSDTRPQDGDAKQGSTCE